MVEILEMITKIIIIITMWLVLALLYMQWLCQIEIVNNLKDIGIL